jgi:hypothetical protein
MGEQNTEATQPSERDTWLDKERKRLHDSIRDISSEEVDTMFDIPQMRSILDLYATQFVQENNIGESSGLRITVTYREPPEQGEIDWKEFKESGPFNQRFLRHALSHHKYWKDKALVPLNIISINYDPENANDEANW